MAIRKVAVAGHPVLRKVAEPVPVKDIKSPAIQALIGDMIETMFEYDGRGLAAPQIYESLQIVVILWDFEKDKESTLVCLINPVIKVLNDDKSTHWEGCLSLPGLRGKVPRPNKISVEAFNQEGEKIKFTAEGFTATVVQHECDHLNGKLYIDQMTDMTSLIFTSEFKHFATDPNEEPAD